MVAWRPFGRGDVGFFDRIARAYDLLMPSSSTTELEAAFDHAERPVSRVLDLAGGTGRVSRSLRTTGYDPLVADASAGMLRLARTHRLPVVHADAGRLPLADDSVDAAVVVDAYHHLPDQQAALTEAARVVAPGGVVVVRDFDPSTLRGRGVESFEHLVGMGSRFATADEVAAALSRAGLRSRVLDRGFVATVVGVVPADP
jgi:SAM-dependent methyltransferase